MKHLIVSGCSYTTEIFGRRSWPRAVSHILDYELHNDAIESQGNGIISRQIINRVTECLEAGISSDDILVGVMWSSFSRHEIFQNNGWEILNHHWKTEPSKTFYRDIYTETQMQIITLEHIMRVQLFLEKHNIKYFMANYTDDVMPIHNQHTPPYYKLIDETKFIKGNCLGWCIENTDIEIYSNHHPTREQLKIYAEQEIIPYLIRQNLI